MEESCTRITIEFPKLDEEDFKRMNIFEEARCRKNNGYGYHSRKFRVVWNSKKVSWNYIMIDWGIRWGDRIQYFPIWNTSNNCDRSLLFGFWKLYFQIRYCRKGSFNQKRKFFMRKKLWRFYQLVS